MVIQAAVNQETSTVFRFLPILYRSAKIRCLNLHLIRTACKCFRVGRVGPEFQECGTSWTRISSCARSLDPGPLSRLRNEGFSANTCFSRPPHAPGHIEMILAFQTFRAEPEKNLSFPPVLHGFSHCGTHRDFDLACREGRAGCSAGDGDGDRDTRFIVFK